MAKPAATTSVPLHLPPGPRPLPVVGNIPHLLGKDRIATFTSLWRDYGDITYLKLGPRHGFVLSSPDHLHHVLVKNQKNYVKGRGYNGLRLLLGQGLITSEGALWQRQRRLMQPSFTPAATTRFLAMMVEVTERALNRWDAAAVSGTALVMDDEMMRLTMSVIGRALFSLDLGEELLEIGQAFQAAFAAITDRTNGAALGRLPLSVPTPANQRFNAAMARITAFIDERIADGRANSGQENLLGLLLRAQDEETGERMDQQQLRDEVMTLYFAGFETTARSLTWAWYLLGRHPEVARKLEAEADAVLAGRAPTWEDLYRLTYTRQVVDEVLRLYPPTAMLARQNLADDVIGGYTVPAGSMIILVPYLVHRYPGVWENPEHFDPERFRPEAAEARPKAAYIPFASGPRVCLGNSFALLEMVLALAMTSARFRLDPITQAPITFSVAGTIRPDTPLRMRVVRRVGQQAAPRTTS